MPNFLTDTNIEHLKSQFFDHAETNFTLWDKDLNCIDANESFLKMIRLQRNEILGKKITDISPDIVTSGHLELYKEVLRTGKTLIIEEMKPISASGNFNFRIKAFKAGDGLGLVIKDITSLKETIENYKMSEEKLNTFVNTTDEMLHHLSPTGEIIWVNDAWKKHMGVTQEEVIGKKIFDYIDEPTTVEFNRIMPTIMKGNRVDNLSCKFISKAGEIIFLEGQTFPVIKNGSIVGSNAFLRNVTHVKKLEQERIHLNITLEQKVMQRTAELQNSKASLLEAEKIAKMGTWEMNFVDNKTKWSDNLLDLFGLKINEIEPSFEYLMSRVHPDDIHLFQNANPVLMTEKEPVELEIRIMSSGNNYKWVLNRIVPVIEGGQVIGLKGINIDITEQKRIHEQLQKSLSETSDYKFALDESSIVAITDQKGVIIKVNDNFCKISTYTSEELIGQDHRIINSGYHPKEFIRNLWTTIANGNIWKGELKNQAKDGSSYWVDTTIVPFLNEQGKPYQYLAISSVISERKKIGEELLKLKEELEQKVQERTKEITRKEEQYHLLIDTMREGVLYVNNEDEIQFANKYFYEMTEYSKNEIIGRKANEIFLDEDNKGKIKAVNESRKNNVKSNYELQIKTKSGKKIWVSINGAPVINEKGLTIGSVGVHADISILKQHISDLEEILFSLSHKVRQPVSNILGISNLLDNDLIEINELRKIANCMRDSANSLDQFTKEMNNLVWTSKQKVENKNWA